MAMLSSLSRGYSSWESGKLDLVDKTEHRVLPEVGPSEHHKHGVTVTPRTPGRGHTAPTQPTTAPKDNGSLELPKTFLTRKGALLLFTAPDGPPERDHIRPRLPRKRKQQELINLSLKLGTLERLSMSVLQYGDTDFDREKSSVTDKENRWFLKFLRHLSPPEEENMYREGEDPLTDRHVQPGGDLRVYLQDLKRRASSRGYGRESSLSSRTRSTELREILQQLEEAWPTSYSQPVWQAPSSFADGSQFSTEEFLYPRSPSISSESSRTLSRAKVLSSHKLTASLKSLNYLGRPASTELGVDTRSVTSPDIPPRSSLPHHLTTRRTKSAYWTGTPSPPSPPELRSRPQTSHHSARVPSGGERFSNSAGKECEDEGVPVIEEETRTQLAEAGESYDRQGISVQVGISEHGDSLPTMGSVIEESEGQVDLDRISMSSLQREEDLTLPSDGEEADDMDGTKEKWMDMREDGYIEDGTGEDDRSSATRPLQPQYTSVLQDESDVPQATDEDEEMLCRSEQGSRPGSRSASRADQRSQVGRPASVLSSGGASRVGFILELDDEEEEVADQSTLDELMQEEMNDQRSVSSQQKMDALLLDHATQQLANQEKYASSMSGSVDKPEPDPETLVSLQPDDQDSKDDSKSIGQAASESSQAELQERPQVTPGPKPVPPVFAAGRPSEDSTTVSDKKEDDVKMIPPRPTSVLGEREKPVLEEKPAERDMTAEDIKAADVKTEVSSGTSFVEETKVEVPSSPPAVIKEPAASKAQETEALKDKLPKEVKPETKPTPEKKTVTKPASPRKPAVPLRPQGKGDKPDKKGVPDKSYVKAMDITSVQLEKTETDQAESAAKIKKADSKKKESYRPPPPPSKVKVKEKQELVIPEHMKEALARSNSLSQAELENELRKMKQVVDESLGLSAANAEDLEGLTEEELKEAEEALRARMEEAQRKMQEVVDPGTARSKSPEKPNKGPEVKVKKGKKVKIDDKKAEEKAKKEAEKEKKQQERLKRLEEAKALQDLITEKEAQRKAKEEEAARKAKELEEQMEIMRQEEEAIQQAEEDAREQLAALRKAQREEREARRKADLEKKKQNAIAKREKEKAMMEAARQKEQEMLDRIADAEMRRALREEEERKQDEEERLAQERFEEELRLAQLQAEEEEARLQELERQAEEEAFLQIQMEKEEAGRQLEELEEQARKMAAEEERQRQQMMEEEKKLAEEKRRKEAEEAKQREEEKQRLKELQRFEEDARNKMRVEIEKCRESAMKRREVNLDRMKHLDGLRQSQGVSVPWVFSYFVLWPRETYRAPMGGGGQDQKGKKKPSKK